MLFHVDKQQSKAEFPLPAFSRVSLDQKQLSGCGKQMRTLQKYVHPNPSIGKTSFLYISDLES